MSDHVFYIYTAVILNRYQLLQTYNITYKMVRYYQKSATLELLACDNKHMFLII